MNRPRSAPFRLLVALAIAPLGYAGPARSDEGSKDAKTAKAAYVEGLKQYNIGHYPEALAAFERGYLARPDAAFLYNLGQCYRMMQKPEDEIREYHAYLRARPNAQNRAEVERFIHDAEEEVKRRASPTAPTGTLEPSGHSGEPAASAPVVEPVPAAVVATPGEAPPPASTPVYKRWWLWTAVGAGAVAIGLGLGLGLGLGHDDQTTFSPVTF